MSDPLDRDRFPDRPDTQDFWRLSDAVLNNDARATEEYNGRFKELLETQVDEDAIVYMARQRIARTVLRAFGPSAETALISLYLDAFMLGCEYKDRGGHRS